jgi:late competence protein required for DNA uptake (superfamily II DNA/RNA helicase)
VCVFLCQICGVVVSVRRVQHQDKISVWTRDASDKKSVLAIGARLKHELELADNAVITYSKHLNDKAGASAASAASGEKKDNVLFVL